MSDSSATPQMPKDPLGNLPRYVIFRGKRARVLGYENKKFLILDYQDQERLVTRDRITFIKT